jgi:hypothetical protein
MTLVKAASEAIELLEPDKISRLYFFFANKYGLVGQRSRGATAGFNAQGTISTPIAQHLKYHN